MPRIVIYIYGLFVVAIAVAGAGTVMLALVFGAVPVLELLPLSLQKPLITFVLALPFALAFVYLVKRASRLKRDGVPAGFIGWRVLCTGFGMFAFLIGLVVTGMPLLLETSGPGSQSGVPLALGFIISLVFVLPAMSSHLVEKPQSRSA